MTWLPRDWWRCWSDEQVRSWTPFRQDWWDGVGSRDIELVGYEPYKTAYSANPRLGQWRDATSGLRKFLEENPGAKLTAWDVDR